MAVKTADTAIVIDGVRITHPERVLYPDAGMRKADLARYLRAVAPALLPHIHARPLTMVRCPKGATAECFYLRHPQPGAASSLMRVRVPGSNGAGEYVAVDNAEGLLSLAQQSVLEIHTWNTTADALDTTDRLVVDLDPGSGVSWDGVISAALHVRDQLSDAGLTSFVKTTGGKGLHVVVPLDPPAPWDDARRFVRAIADRIVAQHPKDYLAELSKRKRRGKVLIDYWRNARGASAVAPWSPRATRDATVSMPLTWKELESLDDPAVFTISTARARVRRDPWRRYYETQQELPSG